MSFLFPTLLTIGLPLIAVPILIHLINLRRQQRIRWAAMQFLLESQRRNRRWTLCRQRRREGTDERSAQDLL